MEIWEFAKRGNTKVLLFKAFKTRYWAHTKGNPSPEKGSSSAILKYTGFIFAAKTKPTCCIIRLLLYYSAGQASISASFLPPVKLPHRNRRQFP